MKELSNFIVKITRRHIVTASGSLGQKSNGILFKRYRNGNDHRGAALFRFSGQDENLGQQDYYFAEQFFEKIWAGADGAGFVSGLFGTPLNLI